LHLLRGLLGAAVLAVLVGLVAFFRISAATVDAGAGMHMHHRPNGAHHPG